MRILLLTVDFPPARGGIQNLLANLAEGLAAEHEVRVVAPRQPGGAAWDSRQPYSVTRVPRSGFWPLAMFWFWITALVQAVKRPPDVVVCGHAFLGPACAAVAALFGVPYVALAYAYEIRAPRMQRLAGWTLRHASRVITISDFSRRAVLAHGVQPERIAIIRPGVGVPSSIPTDAVTPREESAERFILTVSRLGELYKGHDMVIRAMPLILSQEPNARYVIVGDGPLRRYLERLADAVGVSRAVTFAGEVPGERLNDWFARADVFALLSRESPIDGGAEGYGMAFIEAGAWHKPVVGGRSGGIPDAVVDGVTGFLVDPTDISAIADGILRVLGDPELARRLGAQGHERAVHELSWTNVVAAFQRVLDAAVAPRALKESVRSARP